MILTIPTDLNTRLRRHGQKLAIFLAAVSTIFSMSGCSAADLLNPQPATAEAFCGTLPPVGFGKFFYCGTSQTNLQGGLPNNWLGYCQSGSSNSLGLVGYSATTFNGGRDLVRSFSEAQNMCNNLNTNGLRQCGSIIRCTREQ